MLDRDLVYYNPGMNKKCLLVSVMCVLLSACGTPITPTPAPTPEAINILYPASLQPWADRMSSCAAGDPDMALYFFQQANPSPGTNPDEIELAMGQPSKDKPGAELYQVGWEQVVVVVNQDNPVTKLSGSMLKDIYLGQMSNWEDGSGQPIQAWVLPEGDPAQRAYEAALALNGNLAPQAKLAPNPSAILTEVAKDKNAIGYLPHSILSNSDSADTNKIKIVQLDQSLEQALHQPVIAITWSEPRGLLRSLLACLQTTRN
jgi:PBP superfamily domain